MSLVNVQESMSVCLYAQCQYICTRELRKKENDAALLVCEVKRSLPLGPQNDKGGLVGVLLLGDQHQPQIAEHARRFHQVLMCKKKFNTQKK